MSQFTDTLHPLSASGINSVKNSMDRWVGLSNLSRYLLGSSTLSELLERASRSVVEILGLNYAKVMILEQDNHYYHHITYLENIGATEICNKTPVSEAVERILGKVAASKPALTPYFLDHQFSQKDRLAFSEGKYEYIWLVPLSANSQQIGFLELGKTDAYERDLYLINSTHLVDLIAGQLANAIFRIKLNEKLTNTSSEMVKALTKALEVRDFDSGIHSQHMAALSNQLARRMGCTEKESLDIYWAALLHDIGKIGVEDKILRKASKLDEAEWQIIKKHPEIGAKIVQGLTGLDAIAPLILSHHEHLDGSGYPRGLKGDQIPLGARIISVVDTFSAVIEGRVYQEKRAVQEAVNILVQNKGTQFDAAIVDVLVQMIQERALIF